MSDPLKKLTSVLGSRRAAIKLLLINEGIAIDGNALKRALPDYPDRYRTKRSKIRPRIVENMFIDSETADVPFVPAEIIIAVDGRESIVKVNLNNNSQFMLEIETETLVISALDQPDLKIPARLLPRPDALSKTINGFPVDSFLQLLGSDRLALLGYTGCANWFQNDQCKFCDSCAQRPDDKTPIPSLNDLRTRYQGNIQAWWQTDGLPYADGVKQGYHAFLNDGDIGPHLHLHVMAGNLIDLNAEWDCMLDLSQQLNHVKPLREVDSYLNLLPPDRPEDIDRAHQLGFRNLIFNMEVFGESAFRTVCPGKHKLMPFDRFLQRLDHAVSVFGKGHVHCGFVQGAQPLADLKQGVTFLAERGVVSDYTSFTPKAGTPWAKKRRPDVFETADFAAFLNGLYRRYSFRPLYCDLSSRSSIMNECLH